VAEPSIIPPTPRPDIRVVPIVGEHDGVARPTGDLDDGFVLQGFDNGGEFLVCIFFVIKNMFRVQTKKLIN
jgi:hypothetical protein